MPAQRDTSPSPSCRTSAPASRGTFARAVALAALGLIACGETGSRADDAKVEAKADVKVEPDAKQTEAAPREPETRADVMLVIQDVGFMTPESALHDPVADLYLVSNIEGAPTEEDGNGFISRVTPDGDVQALKWIDGFSDGVTLNAPKGMALVGDALYVADIDHVRKFDRRAGTPAGAIKIEGAKFLNDVAPARPDDAGAAVYVSDMGADVVYRVGLDDAVTPLARGEALAGPNGLASSAQGLFMVNKSGGVFRLEGGEAKPVATAPAGGLDGVVFWPSGGGLLVSSWEGQAVYRVDLAAGAVTTQFGAGHGDAGALVSPADIGFDEKRQRLLVPHFQQNTLRIMPVAPPAG